MLISIKIIGLKYRRDSYRYNITLITKKGKRNGENRKPA